VFNAVALDGQRNKQMLKVYCYTIIIVFCSSASLQTWWSSGQCCNKKKLYIWQEVVASCCLSVVQQQPHQWHHDAQVCVPILQVHAGHCSHLPPSEWIPPFCTYFWEETFAGETLFSIGLLLKEVRVSPGPSVVCCPWPSVTTTWLFFICFLLFWVVPGKTSNTTWGQVVIRSAVPKLANTKGVSCMNGEFRKARP